MRVFSKIICPIVAITGLTFFTSLVSFSQQDTTMVTPSAYPADSVQLPAAIEENVPKGIVRDILDQTNEFRAASGLTVLIDRADLNAIAQKHSEDMASGRVNFGHDGFEQRNEQAKEKIKQLYSFAENVAYGVNSGEAVVKMWKNSFGHRRNMLGNYKYIGIGVAADSHGQLFYTQIFAG